MVGLCGECFPLDVLTFQKLAIHIAFQVIHVHRSGGIGMTDNSETLSLIEVDGETQSCNVPSGPVNF